MINGGAVGADFQNLVCRYGPTPSGRLHVGSARTALFIYLFAKSHGGTFVLRIDDTDVAAANYVYTEEAMESLQWLGIKWDVGPIYQSGRFEIYKQYVQQLVDSGHAYHEETYQGVAIRFRVGSFKSEFVDLIHGPVQEDLSRYEDFVIQRSNGHPTYQIATVVDDHLMGITCLPRGNDLFSCTHMQNALYAALGWEPPRYAHIPLVNGPDGKKLSKRHGHTSVLDFRDNLYLPEAVLNYLAMLGWSAGKNKEILSLLEMVECFDFHKISKKNVTFDLAKLKWLNRQYIKMKSVDYLSRLLYDILIERNIITAEFDKKKFLRIVELVTPRYYSNCDDFVWNTKYFYDDVVDYEDLKPGLIDRCLLKNFGDLLANLDCFTCSGLEETMREYAACYGIPFVDLVQGIRYAVTGRKVTPDIASVMLIIGRGGVVSRIERFVKNFDELVGTSALR